MAKKDFNKIGNKIKIENLELLQLGQKMSGCRAMIDELTFIYGITRTMFWLKAYELYPDMDADKYIYAWDIIKGEIKVTGKHE